MSTSLLTWLLVLEVGLVAVGVIYLLFFSGKKEQQQAKKTVGNLSKRFKKNHKARHAQIKEEDFMTSLSHEFLDEIFDDIKDREAILYQQIVRIFLQKEVKYLQSVDKHIEALSEPYWKAIKEVTENATGAPSGNDDQEITALKNGLQVAISEKERMAERLSSALKTLDAMTNEYSGMFEGQPSQSELLESKQRVIEIFHQVLEQETANDAEQADVKEDDTPVAYEKVEI